MMTKEVQLPETYPLETLVQIINNSLEKAKLQLEHSAYSLNEATIALKTIYDASGGGGFKVFVKASKKFEAEYANIFTYTFSKIETIASIKKLGEESFDFERNLSMAVTRAALQWEKISQTVAGLDKDSFSVQIAFSFKKVTEAGVEFEISGVGINADAAVGNKVVHQITLKFT